MEMQKLLEMLFVLEKEEEKNAIEEKILRLKNGKGGTLFLRSEKDFGQNLFVRYILAKSETTCYYGKGANQALFAPYSPFFSCFPEFFSQFSKKSEKRFSQELEKESPRSSRARASEMSIRVMPNR